VALSQLSLDAVASDAKFRNSDGLLYLLRWFTADTDNHQLRLLLLDVLRHRLGGHPEARKELERAIADPEIVQSMIESTLPDAEFSEWFFGEDRAGQRQAISARLEKSLALAEGNARRHLEKIEERRQKRIRARLETLGRAAASTERAVQDALERSEAVIGRYSKLFAAQKAREKNGKKN
jgi:hypothetical protein